MRVLILLSVLFLFSSAAIAAAPVTITGIIDGDTVRARVADGRQIKIRIYGIDAPERRQPYGQRATQAIKSLISGKRIEMEVMDKDRYGRTVARLLANGQDVGGEMVAAGYAWVYPQFCRLLCICAEYESGEKSARDARLGLWQDQNPIPPWEWRRFDEEEK
jgi:endonuclease YncB( thermonuclease family)